MLGLHCCVGFSLAVASGGYSPGAGSRLLTVVFSLLWDAGSRSQGQWLQCMDLAALRHVGSSRARD